MYSFNDHDVEKSLQNGTGIVEKTLRVDVWFYLHATRNDVLSQKAGYNVYSDTVYCGKKGKGERDFMSGPLQPNDIAEYPAEYKRFQDWMANPQTSVRSLPGMKPSALLMCQDVKIGSIEELASAPIVPKELAPFQTIARQWVSLSKPGAIVKGEATQSAPVAKNKGGRPKGSKNKAKPDEVAKAAA